jgi:hypothetical protein
MSRSNAGERRACRRFLMLIYATVVLSIGWYPWNVLLLVPLLSRRQLKKAKLAAYLFPAPHANAS